MKYLNRTRYSYERNKEKLKGHISQGEAISLLGISFNTFRRYTDSGQLPRVCYDGAYWLPKKDVQKLADTLKAKADTARSLKERGLLVDLPEALFLISLLDRATDTEREKFKQIERKLHTHAERLKKRGKE